MTKSALILACEAVGGQTALARLIGVKSQGVVANWLMRGGVVPAERVLQIERVSGISRSLLRPDLYPPDDEPRAGRNGTTTSTSTAG